MGGEKKGCVDEKKPTLGGGGDSDCPGEGPLGTQPAGTEALMNLTDLPEVREAPLVQVAQEPRSEREMVSLPCFI